MPKKKAVSKRAVRVSGVSLPKGKKVYDMLMKKIEPELVSTNLKKLDAPYKKKKETKAARTKRYRRYASAFKEYKKQYGLWLKRVKKAVAAYNKAMTRAVEKINKNKEDAALHALEAQMSAL